MPKKVEKEVEKKAEKRVCKKCGAEDISLVDGKCRTCDTQN